MDPNAVQNPSQPPVQPLPVQSVSEVPSKNWLKSFLLILLGVVVLLAVAGGSYYLGTQKISTSTVATKAKVSPTSPPTPTPDTTANWQTYTAPTIAISVKYPQGWTVTERKAPGQVYGVTLSGVQGSVDIAWGSNGGGFGGACTDGTQQTLNFGGENVTACERLQGQNESWGLLYKKVGNISFSANAIVNACPGIGCGPISATVAQETLATNQKIIFAILSHITFSSLQTNTDWQTYTAGTYAIKYPNTWKVKSDSYNPNSELFYDPASLVACNPNHCSGSLPTKYVNISTQTSSETAKQYADKITSGPVYKSEGSVENPVTFNGLSGYIYKDAGEGSQGYIIVFSSGTTLVTINIPYGDITQDATIYQMLQSFKFTE